MEKLERKRYTKFTSSPNSGCYVLGQEGFLKSVEFIKEERRFVIEWTRTLQEARNFPMTKGAKNLIDKHGLVAWVWQPWKEHHNGKKWWVREHDGVWEPLQAFGNYSTQDANCLGKSTEITYDSLQEATSVAIQRNQELVEYITKLNEQMRVHSEKMRISPWIDKFGL